MLFGMSVGKTLSPFQPARHPFSSDSKSPFGIPAARLVEQNHKAAARRIVPIRIVDHPLHKRGNRPSVIPVATGDPVAASMMLFCDRTYHHIKYPQDTPTL
jgi:hypothetical protein